MRTCLDVVARTTLFLMGCLTSALDGYGGVMSIARILSGCTSVFSRRGCCAVGSQIRSVLSQDEVRRRLVEGS